MMIRDTSKSSNGPAAGRQAASRSRSTGREEASHGRQVADRTGSDPGAERSSGGLTDPRAETKLPAEQEESVRASGAIKDPKDWTTGDEPMTGAQESYLDTLSREAGEEVSPDLTKAEASEKIEELREVTGRASTPPRRKTLDS